MRIIAKLLSVAVAGILLSGCSITHTYGPYVGKVVEKETSEPIEGAVVFMRFSTKPGNLGGSTTHYADAVEVLTDAKGEFLIPPHTLKFDDRPFHKWDKQGSAIIFKPGYGAFPGHRQSLISHYREGRFPDNEFVTIKLPKLKTREERKKNLRNLYYDSTEVPVTKQKFIMKLSDEESVTVGLSPR